MKRIIVLIFALTIMAAPAHAAIKFVTIGTGGVTGVYYPSGKAIAKMVNLKRAEYKLKVTVESTGGSVFNINAILAGDLDVAIAQSDRQYEAWNGLAEWKGKGPQKNLRSMFSLHTETFFLVASQASGIKDYPGIKGKAIAVGNPGSGQRQNFVDMMHLYGLGFKDLGRADGLKAAESAKMIQDGRVDAFVYTVGNPAGLIKEATSGRERVRFIGAAPDKLKTLTEKFPYYVIADIPVKMYPKVLNKKDVPTLAVKATVVTRAEVSDDVVYAITKEIFSNLNKFKTLHPAFGRLTKENMLQGLSAPLHPGALKYFKEAGLK